MTKQMSKQEFYELFLKEVDFYEEFTGEILTGETPLENFSNWDSLARATVFNFVAAKLNQKLNYADLKQCRTMEDLTNLIGI